jgi:hypothetical protein
VALKRLRRAANSAVEAAVVIVPSKFTDVNTLRSGRSLDY